MTDINTVFEKEIIIPANGVNLQGILKLPESPKGLVVFSHGSGSSRLSPRNNYVADVINTRDYGTLLFDLLTEEEDQVYKTRFNIALLTDRLINATRWIQDQPDTKGLSIGYFGASTGAASALMAAAELKSEISAIVSRGGRPDMAMPVLEHIAAPTLLIVGGFDTTVIELNQEAFAHLSVRKELKIIPGASHLFQEPGKLEQVASLACSWFEQYL